MRVLIGCEFSGVVRRAFRALGHDAFSCDLLPSEDDSPYHIQGDVLDAIKSRRWDLAIFHPPCTHLAVSGARWAVDHWVRRQGGDRWHDGSKKRAAQVEALDFVRALMAAPIPRIAIENPISIISTQIRKPDQIIQPYDFGHGETKATCLWLKNLPLLTSTDQVAGREARVHMMPPGPDRWRERSRTFSGIASAFASQWGVL